MPLTVQDVDGRAELVEGVHDAWLGAEVAAPLTQLAQRCKVDLEGVGDLAVTEELPVAWDAAYRRTIWMCG